MFKLTFYRFATTSKSFTGYLAYSLTLKAQGLIAMFCVLKVYGVAGFGQLQLLLALSAFFNSVATFGSPSLAVAKISAADNSVEDPKVRHSIVELLRFSSLNYVIIIFVWFTFRSYFPFFVNLSELNIQILFVVFLFGFIFQGNLFLLNVLNALNSPANMMTTSVLRIFGTILSTLVSLHYRNSLDFFLLFLALTELLIFLYQVFFIDALKWIPRVVLSHESYKVAGYGRWILRIRYQASAGILVSLGSLLLQNLLTVNQSSFDNGVYNFALRIAAIFVFPLSVVNLTIFSRSKELASRDNSIQMTARYIRNSSIYVAILFVLGLVILDHRHDLAYGWLLLAVCLFMLGTALNSYSSNVLIATQSMKEWAFSDVLLGSSSICMSILLFYLSALSTTSALNAMSIAMLISTIYAFRCLRRRT